MRVVVELGLASSVFVLSECSPPNRLGSSCSNCCHGRNRAPTAEAIYEQMWAQDVVAMLNYHAVASAAAIAGVFCPNTFDPANQATRARFAATSAGCTVAANAAS